MLIKSIRFESELKDIEKIDDNNFIKTWKLTKANLIY